MDILFQSLVLIQSIQWLSWIIGNLGSHFIDQILTHNFNLIAGQRLKLQAATKQAHAKGRPKGLAPTLNNLLNEYQIGEGRTQEKAQIITFRPASEDEIEVDSRRFTNFFHRILEHPLGFDLCRFDEIFKQVLTAIEAFQIKRILSPEQVFEWPFWLSKFYFGDSFIIGKFV